MNVVPDALLQVTLNPVSRTVSAGHGVRFTVAATSTLSTQRTVADQHRRRPDLDQRYGQLQRPDNHVELRLHQLEHEGYQFRAVMLYLSTHALAFRAKVARWIAERYEVLALIRYSHMAGSKDFEFFDSAEAFEIRLRELPARTCVTVFGERRLPLRGAVDDAFIRQALDLVPDGRECVIVGFERVTYGKYRWPDHSADESSVELREDLRDRQGKLVAVGQHPSWLEDGEELVSAIVPNPDGSMTI